MFTSFQCAHLFVCLFFFPAFLSHFIIPIGSATLFHAVVADLFYFDLQRCCLSLLFKQNSCKYYANSQLQKVAILNERKKQTEQNALTHTHSTKKEANTSKTNHRFTWHPSIEMHRSVFSAAREWNAFCNKSFFDIATRLMFFFVSFALSVYNRIKTKQKSNGKSSSECLIVVWPVPWSLPLTPRCNYLHFNYTIII